MQYVDVLLPDISFVMESQFLAVERQWTVHKSHTHYYKNLTYTVLPLNKSISSCNCIFLY
jgi:hypothetical protein